MSFRKRHPLSIELLEDRWTPAGTVTGSFANGTWTLIGDAEPNVILINPGAGNNQFTVTGQNGTAVEGVTNASNVKHIVVKLRGGDDEFEVNDTGALVRLVGNLKIDGGNGANYVYIDDLKMRNLTVTNGANASGFDQFYLPDSIVQKNVTINNGAGNSETEFYRGNSNVSTIGGNVTITNGVGKDFIDFHDTHVGGNVFVKNGLPDASNFAGSTEFYNQINEAGRSIIRGNVFVSYQGGEVDYDGIWDTEVLGNVKFKYGTGSSMLYFDGSLVLQPVHIHGNLTVTGQGNNLVEIGRGNEKTGLIVDKNFTVLTGAGTDVIDINRLNVGGATRIATGSLNDFVDIDDSSFAGPTTILTGAGFDSVFVEFYTGTAFGTQFAKALKVLLGAGDDYLGIGFGGDDTRMVEVLAAVKLVGGDGTDERNQFNLVQVFGAPIDALFEKIQV